MKHIFKIAAFLFCFSLSAQTIDDLSFGTDDSFEIMTWNIKEFPKKGQDTFDYVSQIIQALDVDFIAIQEISDETVFNVMVNNLASYNGYIESTYYDGLAFLYKPSIIQINNIYRIYDTSNYWNTFPRAPMVIDITYNNQQLVVINNHLKCCGDGTLVLNDSIDEEYRRYEAIHLLKDYIDTNLQNENVILLGDLNDELTDEATNNVFQYLIDDSSNYLFSDYSIASGSSTNWSYPSWPSHLDHILITNELFDEFQLASSNIETIKIDNYLSGGWIEYSQYVSDHRPVALKLTIDSNLSVNDVSKNQSISFINYPNPSSFETTFSFKNGFNNAEIEVFNALGQIVFSTSIPNGHTSYQWKTRELPNGIYNAKLLVNKKQVANRKIVISK